MCWVWRSSHNGFDDEEEYPTYFEFLHKEEDGSFTAFHREFHEQMDLCLVCDDLH